MKGEKRKKKLKFCLIQNNLNKHISARFELQMRIILVEPGRQVRENRNV